jgi:hypothetical protein
MGVLGTTEHFQCRNCGAEFSTPVGYDYDAHEHPFEDDGYLEQGLRAEEEPEHKPKSLWERLKEES